MEMGATGDTQTPTSHEQKGPDMTRPFHREHGYADRKPNIPVDFTLATQPKAKSPRALKRKAVVCVYDRTRVRGIDVTRELLAALGLDDPDLIGADT